MIFPLIARLSSSTALVRSFSSSIILPPKAPILKNTPSAINIKIDGSIIGKITNYIPESRPESHPNAHSKIPDSQEIKQVQKGLAEIFRRDGGVQEYFRELSKASKGSAVGFHYDVPKVRDNPHGRCLTAFEIMSCFGLLPKCNKSGALLFGEVTKGVGKVDGHRDKIFNDDGELALVKDLAIINLGGSTSDCKTWYKSNELILEELERDFPSSYYILKTINFTSKDCNKTQPMIGEDNKLNFINHFSCLPVQSNLDEYGISKEKASEAKINLDNVINSKEGRKLFFLRMGELRYRK